MKQEAKSKKQVARSKEQRFKSEMSNVCKKRDSAFGEAFLLWKIKGNLMLAVSEMDRLF